MKENASSKMLKSIFYIQLRPLPFLEATTVQFLKCGLLNVNVVISNYTAHTHIRAYTKDVQVVSFGVHCFITVSHCVYVRNFVCLSEV